MSGLRDRRVLITGAGGFLGRHVVTRLVAEGAVVTACVRRRAPSTFDSPVAAAKIFLDVTDAAAVDKAFAAARPELVIHLAGDTSARRGDVGPGLLERTIDVNVRGTALIAMAAIDHGAERVVRTGGLEEYGVGPTPSVETQREEPVSPYSASQVAATHFLQALQRTSDVTNLVTLRPAVVYGPGQPTTFFIGALIEHALGAREFAMTAGLQRRDLIYIDDVVDGIVAALVRPLPRGLILNLSHGTEHRILDVAMLLHRLLGRGEVRVGASTSSGPDLEHLAGCSDLAAELLDWRPKVNLEEGLRRTIASFGGATAL